ncbi:MAG: response regulator transcription factor [Rhizobiaceae bacterium]|nr:response regulator transcription factor [Rhizobiaceae bacterium]MCV0405610.1 response regulator transcription factor [Rhizobiaceae bacterium]
MTTNDLTILLADDHPLVLRGLVDLLAGEPRLKLLDPCRDGVAALGAVRRHRPDIAVVDVNMPGLDGLAFLRALRADGLPTRVILLTGELNDSGIFDALSHDLSGLVFKDAAPETLVDCIREVGAGRRWLPAEIVGPAIARETDRREKGRHVWAALTDREREIAVLMARNISNKEMAHRLGITEGTVKIHLNRIYSKLNVPNRSALVSLIAPVVARLPGEDRNDG